jgi:hypothetical protein
MAYETEQSTGRLLMRVEALESQILSLQRQVIDAMCDRDIALARYERERQECDEQARIVMRLSAKCDRLLEAGDGLVAVISNCECVATERCGWCIAKDKWEEARRG